MKLGFWTLGMPAWSNAEIASRAKQLSYDSVVLRPSNFGGHGAGLSDADLDGIRQTYAEAGIEIDVLTTGSSRSAYEKCDSDKVDWDEVVSELVPYAQIAGKLGIPRIMVRVQRPGPGVRWDWQEYLDGLGKAARTAIQETPGVNAVFENHVSSANARQLLEMVERAGDGRLGVVFSPDHCVVMQENPIDLAQRHAAAIQHVCLADRRPVEEDLGKFDGRYYYVRYEACPVGEGTVPFAEILSILGRQGYNGHVALKWEKSDQPVPDELPNGFGQHLPDGEDVLPSFVNFMRSLDVEEVRK